MLQSLQKKKKNPLGTPLIFFILPTGEWERGMRGVEGTGSLTDPFSTQMMMAGLKK